MHEPEVGVEQVKVVNQALAPIRADAGTAVAVGQPERQDWLDRGQNADEPTGDALTLCDLASEFLLAHGASEVAIRAAGTLGDGLGVALQPISHLERDLLELHELEAQAAHPVLHARRMADGQVPLEDHPVEAG